MIFAPPLVNWQVYFVTPQTRPVTPHNFLILTVVLFILLWVLVPETLVLMVPAVICSFIVSHTHLGPQCGCLIIYGLSPAYRAEAIP